MTRSRHIPSTRPSRRELFKHVGITTAAASLAATLGSHAIPAQEPTSSSVPNATAAASSNRHVISGIDPKNIVDEYARRDLDGVSDADLCRQAAAIISKPPVKGGSSFGLHAPLELLARYGLLPLVDPQDRTLIRRQMVLSAATFEAGTTAGDPPAKISPFPNPADAKAEFTRVFQKGDANGLEAIMLQFAAQYGTASLVQILTPLALTTLSGASHSHIGLWLLLRHARASDIDDASLLRAAARGLSGNPGNQLASFSRMTALEGKGPLKQDPSEIEKEVLQKLATAPRGKQAYGSMFTLITAGEKTGNPDSLFGEFMQHDLTNEQIDAAFRAVLRACALNMLQHGPQFAKFGWSHCLTLPQAACGLSSLNMNRKLALAAALVWITGYRSVLSDHDLDLEFSPKPLEGSASLKEALHTSPEVAAARVWHADQQEYPQIKQTLATQASIRTDQHLVKYTRACLDMVSFDPQQEKLYLAACAQLCGLWAKEQPESKIKGQ